MTQHPTHQADVRGTITGKNSNSITTKQLTWHANGPSRCSTSEATMTMCDEPHHQHHHQPKWVHMPPPPIPIFRWNQVPHHWQWCSNQTTSGHCCCSSLDWHDDHPPPPQLANKNRRWLVTTTHRSTHPPPHSNIQTQPSCHIADSNVATKWPTSLFIIIRLTQHKDGVMMMMTQDDDNMQQHGTRTTWQWHTTTTGNSLIATSTYIHVGSIERPVWTEGRTNQNWSQLVLKKTSWNWLVKYNWTKVNWSGMVWSGCLIIGLWLQLHLIKVQKLDQTGPLNTTHNLKLAAMHMHDQGILSVPDIIDCLQIGCHTCCQVLDPWRTTGNVMQHTNRVHSWPHLLHFDDIDYLQQIIRAHPDWFLNELLELLETNCFILAHYLTIHQELVQAGISIKKLNKIALECNENLHANYIHHMAQYSPEQLGFLDEISKDERTSARSQGQSRKGTCTVKKGVFVHRWHFSAEGLLTIDSMVANTVVEESMTWDWFLQFLEFTVVWLPVIYHECIYSPILLQDAILCPIPQLSQCPCHGQCQDHHREGIHKLAPQFHLCLDPLVCLWHPHLF